MSHCQVAVGLQSTLLLQLVIDSEESESSFVSDDDDDDYSPEVGPTPSSTSASVSAGRKRKAAAAFESEEDSEDEKLIERWRKAAKAKKPRLTAARPPKSALKKTKAVEPKKDFDPMTVLGKQQINQKSKLSDLILHTIAKNQVCSSYQSL